MTMDSQWRKASRSGGNGGQCVEVRRQADVIEVRDSKDAGSGPILRFSAQAWAEFLAGTKDGEFDRLTD